MRTPRIAGPPPATLAQGFDAIRVELELPGAFPPDVERAAERAAAAPLPRDRADRRDLPFVTIDPPGSTDLDQALHIAADGDGWVLSYAIADIGLYAPVGGPVDAEARARGETIYLPDGRVLLSPAVLTEDVASLLPDRDRPCVLFTIPVSAAAGPAVPPGTVGAATVDPEELTVAALASCHMLFFLALAAKRGLVIDAYGDDPIGVLESKDGATSLTRITLRPRVTWAGEPPAAAVVDELHHEAHKRCYIANSLRSEVVIEPAAAS